jgi:hypothetical protein
MQRTVPEPSMALPPFVLLAGLAGARKFRVRTSTNRVMRYFEKTIDIVRDIAGSRVHVWSRWPDSDQRSTVNASGGFPYKITQPGSYKLSGI